MKYQIQSDLLHLSRCVKNNIKHSLKKPKKLQKNQRTTFSEFGAGVFLL